MVSGSFLLRDIEDFFRSRDLFRWHFCCRLEEKGGRTPVVVVSVPFVVVVELVGRKSIGGMRALGL